MIKFIFCIIILGFQLDALSLRPTRYSCANLENYKTLLKTTKPKYLKKHPNCNAAAIKTALKNEANRNFWINEIEPAYQKHFKHPSGVFLDCDTCMASLPRHTKKYFEEKFKDKEYIFVLSVDGGGIRGIMPAKILHEISQQTGKEITDIFDIFVGTSTGGLIALFLNIPNLTPRYKQGTQQYTTEELVDLYEKLPRKIFSHSNILRKLRGAGGLLTSRYSAKSYENFLKEHFHNVTLAQTINPVLVTSFNAEDGEPFFFNTLDAIYDSDTDSAADKKIRDRNNYFLWQAARATSAAPTYFKPYVLLLKGEKFQLIDGGVGANDPVSMGINMAKRLFPHKKIILVSLGTGYYRHKKKFSGGGAFGGGAISGFGKNVNSIMNILFNAANTHRAAALSHTLGADKSFYLIINPRLEREIGLDSLSEKDMKYLEKVADTTIQQDHVLKNLIDTIKEIDTQKINDENLATTLFKNKQRVLLSTCTQDYCSPLEEKPSEKTPTVEYGDEPLQKNASREARKDFTPIKKLRQHLQMREQRIQ